MRKLIAGINMSLDGFCDHTAMSVDDEIHEYYNDMLRDADTIIWGRITYQLMEDYWPSVVQAPTGNKPEDDFAILADNIQKIVYSRTLPAVSWKNTILKKELIRKEILELKQQPGRNILVGSPSLIVAFANLGLVDELQLAVHPTIVGKGLPLFKNITERIDLDLSHTKTFACGAIALYYNTVKKK